MGSSGFGRKTEELAPLRFIQITDVYWVPTEGSLGAEKQKHLGPREGHWGRVGLVEGGAQEVKKEERNSSRM